MTTIKRPLALALIGPTASGKTALSLEIARYLPVEIISVDSALVYRDMNIGTAKPDQAILSQIPHHLIDIMTPLDSYSAAQFRDDCVRLMQDIHQRGKVPLLVGGTMLYIQALLKGLNDLPQADESIRLMIDQQAKASGWPALHKALSLIDPVTAKRLSENDSQRIQRALEIYEITGNPMSALLNKQMDNTLPCDLYCIALTVENRALLHSRIAQRLDAMFEAGFIDEVRQIRSLYPGLDLSFPSMRCVGYRQVWQYLDGLVDLCESKDQALYATRQLCKRQLTWLRSMAIDYTIDAFDANVSTSIHSVIRKLASNDQIIG